MLEFQQGNLAKERKAQVLTREDGEQGNSRTNSRPFKIMRHGYRK